MTKTQMEMRIFNTLRRRGIDRREADEEAEGYTKAFFKGEVECETIAAVSGIAIEEVRQQARDLAQKRRQQQRRR